MGDYQTKNRTKRFERKMFDISSYEFDSSIQHGKKVIDGCHFGDGEVDDEYAWFLSMLIKTNEQKKSVMEEAIPNGDEDECEDEDEGEGEGEGEDEDEDVDEKDKDPQYCMFFKALTKHGKAYKLKVSKDDEPEKFVVYEEEEKSDMQDHSIHANFSIDDNGDKENSSEVERRVHGKEGAGKKKVQENEGVDSCYRLLLDGHLNTKYGAFSNEGKEGDDEESSDSDIMIWENVKGSCEVNTKEAKKEPCLKEELMQILRKPYNRKEYEELVGYVEEEKPICRLLPLRFRTVSSALGGVTKSVLDNVPRSFRRKLECAGSDRGRALNLLRMFRFWLEHVPNEDVFQPWLDEDCLKVVPGAGR